MPTLAPALTITAAGGPRQLEEDFISQFFSAAREHLPNYVAEVIRPLVQQHYWWAALVVVTVVAVLIFAMYAERYEKKRFKKKGNKKKGYKKK